MTITANSTLLDTDEIPAVVDETEALRAVLSSVRKIVFAAGKNSISQVYQVQLLLKTFDTCESSITRLYEMIAHERECNLRLTDKLDAMRKAIVEVDQNFLQDMD